jgi:hypothetical protein
MKIQVLELPMQVVGEVTHTPFVLVFSGTGAADLLEKSEKSITEITGARAALVFEDEDVEVVR